MPRRAASLATRAAPRAATTTERDLDRACVDTIRTLAMDAVEQAKSGHPGTPMALAPAAYTLWQRVLRYDPENPTWPNRDRFVLSNGHASMLLYALLHLTGYDLPVGEHLLDFLIRRADEGTLGRAKRQRTVGNHRDLGATQIERF